MIGILPTPRAFALISVKDSDLQLSLKEEFHHGLEDPPAYVASDDGIAPTADSGSAHETPTRK